MSLKIAVIFSGLGALAAFGYVNARGNAPAPAETGETFAPVETGGGSSTSGLTVKQKALLTIQEYDQSNYGGWFASNGIIDHQDLMAVFSVESGFDPYAINENDGGVSNDAYGMGQMLGTTAQDMGYEGESLLGSVELAVKSTMDYFKWMYDYLRARIVLVRRSDWIGAYNSGVGNEVKGFDNVVYMAKINTHKALLIA